MVPGSSQGPPNLPCNGTVGLHKERDSEVPREFKC